MKPQKDFLRNLGHCIALPTLRSQHSGTGTVLTTTKISRLQINFQQLCRIKTQAYFHQTV